MKTTPVVRILAATVFAMAASGKMLTQQACESVAGQAVAAAEKQFKGNANLKPETSLDNLKGDAFRTGSETNSDALSSHSSVNTSPDFESPRHSNESTQSSFTSVNPETERLERLWAALLARREETDAKLADPHHAGILRYRPELDDGSVSPKQQLVETCQSLRRESEKHEDCASGSKDAKSKKSSWLSEIIEAVHKCAIAASEKSTFLSQDEKDFVRSGDFVKNEPQAPALDPAAAVPSQAWEFNDPALLLRCDNGDAKLSEPMEDRKNLTPEQQEKREAVVRRWFSWIDKNEKNKFLPKDQRIPYEVKYPENLDKIFTKEQREQKLQEVEDAHLRATRESTNGEEEEGDSHGALRTGFRTIFSGLKWAVHSAGTNLASAMTVPMNVDGTDVHAVIVDAGLRGFALKAGPGGLGGPV